MRKHISWYLKNIPNSSKIKNKINVMTKKEKIINLLEETLNK